MKKSQGSVRAVTLVVTTLAVVIAAMAWMGPPTSAAQTVTVYKNPT